MIRKEWNRTLDRYLNETAISSDDYDNLNETQLIIIQELKKSFKRLIKKYD